MKKLNNKGMTLAELIITFAMLTIIVVSMLVIVNEISEVANLKKEINNITDFKNILLKDINDDVTKNRKAIKIEGHTYCDGTKINFKVAKKILPSEVADILLEIYEENNKIVYDNKDYLVPEGFVLLSHNCSIAQDIVTIEIDIYKTMDMKVDYTTKEDATNYGFKIVVPLLDISE